MAWTPPPPPLNRATCPCTCRCNKVSNINGGLASKVSIYRWTLGQVVKLLKIVKKHINLKVLSTLIMMGKQLITIFAHWLKSPLYIVTQGTVYWMKSYYKTGNVTIPWHMMMILKKVLMWSNMWSRYGHIAFPVLKRLDPPVLGPSGSNRIYPITPNGHLPKLWLGE